MLEKDIESAVCKYAQQTYDMLARKYTSPSHRSVTPEWAPGLILGAEGYCATRYRKE